MSLRMSLAMANCWRCESCVELTPAQRRALDEAMRTSPAAPSRGSRTLSSVGEIAGTMTPRSRTLSADHEYAVGPRRQRMSFRDRVNAIPAWLVSLLFHLLLLMILALVLLPQEVRDEHITITTFVDAADLPGGEVQIVDADLPLQDDLLPAPLLEMGEAELRQFKMRAEQDAKQLQVDDAPLASLPDVASVRQSITT
jgi:hypothetical protein